MRPSDDLIVSSVEPTGVNRKKVWMQEFPNLIKNLKVGDINTETGLEVEYLGFIITADYVQVESNTEYYALYNPLNSENTQCVIYEFDENKNYLGFTYVNKSRYNFITKVNTQYLKCRFMDTNLDIKCILRKNEQKIYIKNDNDVYEEFISKENLDNYSTEETKIGTWINGKPLYRKVITYNEYITKNILVSVSHNIINLENIVKCEAILQWSNNFYPFPTHYQNQENEIVVNSIDSSNINFTSYGDNWGGHVIYFTLEYTKTTD